VAIALRRKGFDAHVYEAAPKFQPVGKGIWVPTNAMQVFDRLGLANAIQSAGWPLERIRISTRAQVRLLEVDLRKFQAKYGHLTISIHRADLVRILADALPGPSIHLGKRMVGFTQDENGVSARFEDGTAAHGDLLVGADGIRSVVRETIFPGIPLRYSGQTCYRGVAAMELAPELTRTCLEVWGGPARMGFSAIGPGQIYWFAPVSAEVDTASSSGAALSGDLIDRYAEFPAPIPDILRATPPEGIIRTDLHDFATLDRWSRGRAVLLGDAAHAMTPNLGQGGAQAVEDAYVLADRLAACSTMERAFLEYERIRLKKVHWVAKMAWRLGQIAHLTNPLLRGLRDRALRLTPVRFNDSQVDRVLRLEY